MFAILMALVVLLSSTGFGLVEHHCMVRGKTVQLISLDKTHGCSMCAKKATIESQTLTHPVFKKKACCEENQKHHKVEVVSSVSQSTTKILKASDVAADLPLRLSLWLLEAELGPGNTPTFSFLSFSSRFHGRSMLSFVQSFLI